MKLADLNPFLPKDPVQQALFIETFKREVYIYRRKPPFWIGLSVALGCSWILIAMIDTVARLMMFPIIMGLAVAHDTITSHFTKRLIEARNSSTIHSTAEQIAASDGDKP